MIFSLSRKVGISFLVAVFPLSLFAETLTREATYYSDSFDGGQTSNGDIFDQEAFSAAICGINLDQYIYVSKGSTGVVLDANDRPNCNKYPGVIDFPREVFRLFAPLSIGRLSDIQVTPLGPAPTSRNRGFLPLDAFRHLGVILESKIPTVLFAGEGIEIRGRVLTTDKYALLYATANGGTPVSLLVPVGKDGAFRGFIRLPDTVGDIVFVVAGGNSFDTDKYATLSLIRQSSLAYPSLPVERLRYTPKLTVFSGLSPAIILPEKITGEIEIRQKGNTYKTSGKVLVLDKLPFQIGESSVSITGYRTITPSSLDRSARYPSIFSGTIFLDRTHDTVGRDTVSIQQKINNANFRFITPTDYRIREKYYITRPNGTVMEGIFPKTMIRGGYLEKGITATGSFRMDLPGTYMLEIVREDGIAHANIALSRGLVWSVIDPLTDAQVSTIRNNLQDVLVSTLSRVNIIRKQASLSPVKIDNGLSRVAQAKVDDMIKRKYQGHLDPDGNYIDALALKLGVDPGGAIGENIGFGTVSDLSLEDGLEESGVHRINMQNPEWTRVGIGYGVNGGKVYLVQVFGE